MADCSYSRCIQQRRNIRRELQRWTKNMVHIVGLERIAEELMGRRKWKLYQGSMSRNYLQPLNNVKTKANQEEEFCKDQQQTKNQITTETATVTTIENTTDHRGEQHIEEQSKDTSLTSQQITTGTTTPSLREEGGEKEDAESKKENNQLDHRLTDTEDRLNDWKPQTKCYFCVDGKLDSEHINHGVLSPRHSDSDSTESHSDNEAPPSLTSLPSVLLNNNHHHHHRILTHPVAPTSGMTTIESMAALAAVAALSGANSPGAPPGRTHLPFYAPTMQNWFIDGVPRILQTGGRIGDVLDRTPPSAGEQPLDLSSKAPSNNNSVEKTPNNVRLPTLDTKHIFKAKPRMSAVAGRRTYTEEELQAALRDIQSGKLGTRRAAVIYGIPRSTLRNKVYKLALERERESHINSTTPLKIEEEEPMEDEKDLSGAEEEKEVEKALQAPLLSMADIIRFSNMESPAEALKNMLQKTKEAGSEVWAGLERSEVGPYLILASQNLLAAQQKQDNPALNQLPEIMKMMAEDQLLKEQLKLHQQNNGDVDKLLRPSPSNSVITKVEKIKSESDLESTESPSNVILKIPSFIPTTSKNGCDLFRNTIEGGCIVSPPVTSESGSPPIIPNKGISIKDVKDVIAQSISQKFQQPLEPSRRSMMEIDYSKRTAYTPPGISVIKSQAEAARQYQPPPKPQQNTSSSSATGGKGTRPKRGKYRNYDRDSLVEAVRAVQRGEMSVHRAGSYYGVPHSTLEYKVKERHLMRPRKRDPKPNPVDEKIASLKQNDIRNAQQQQDKMKPVMKPPQKFPPTSPNGMKLPIFEPGMAPLGGYNPAPFPFWAHPGFSPHIPLEYNRNPTAAFPPTPEYYASQMIQKLQEESRLGNSSQTSPAPGTPQLAKSARQMAESLLEGTGANGSFLDGIIRSSLESGVPVNEDKTSKEDKNIAPENMSNKALLDQLCRNSRLTPLSKPMTDVHSPGDEQYSKGPSPLNFSTGQNSNDDKMDTSPGPYERENSDVPTIELSNDSTDSSDRKGNLKDSDEQSTSPVVQTPPARIYLKQDLVNPDNLKPEMLVRFSNVRSEIEQNGVSENSASDDND